MQSWKCSTRSDPQRACVVTWNHHVFSTGTKKDIFMPFVTEVFSYDKLSEIGQTPPKCVCFIYKMCICFIYKKMKISFVFSFDGISFFYRKLTFLVPDDKLLFFIRRREVWICKHFLTNILKDWQIINNFSHYSHLHAKLLPPLKGQKRIMYRHI